MPKTEQGQISKRNNFLIHGGILAAAGILVRIIGLAYRIPLIRIIGDEGMGYYSVAFNIYSVILLLSSYSLPLAVSKIISPCIAAEDELNARRILKAALIYATGIGAVCCAFMWFTADWFADVFYRIPLCRYALKTLAPTLWVMTYLGVLRGYYQGHSTMVPTAASQIIEQIVNAAVSVGAAYLLSRLALEQALGESVSRAYGAAGGTIGTGMGALAALLSLTFLLLRDRRRALPQTAAGPGVLPESYRSIAKALILTIIPVILSSAIYNISGIIDAHIYADAMTAGRGLDPADVAARYGAYTGKFKTLVNIPIAISNALSSSLIPVMSTAAAVGDKDRMNSSISTAVRYAVLIGIPASIGLTVLGGPVITLLFGHSGPAEQMTMIGSFTVAFYSLSTVTNAVLQGMGHMELPVRHAAISLAVHVAVLFFLLRVLQMDIQAVVLSDMLFAFLMCLLNARSIAKLAGYRQEIRKTFLWPLAAGILMGLVTLGIRLALTRFTSAGSLVLCLVCIPAAVAVYAAIVLLSGSFRLSDFRRRP